MRAAQDLMGRLYAAPWLLLILTALFWGGNAVAAGLAVGELSPMLLVLLRWVFTAIAMLILFGRETAQHLPALSGRYVELALMAMAGFSLFNGLLYGAAQLGASSINIGIIQGSLPVMVLAGGALFHGARIGALAAFGVALTLIGVSVVATKGAPHLLLRTGLGAGEAAMLLACFFYASYTLALKRRPPIPGRALFTVLAVFAVLSALPLALIELAGGAFQAPTPVGWLLLAWVVIFPSILAQLFFMRGVDLIGPGRAGVFVNLVPVFAAFLSVLILSQPFETFHAVSLALVLIGLWLSQRRG